MAARVIEFDPESLLKLLVHYSDGRVPLDAKLIGFGYNPLLTRYLGLEIETSEVGEPVIHVRYEGRRVMTWDERGTPVEWTKEGEGYETPKKQ